jgi:hypothetical protein
MSYINQPTQPTKPELVPTGKQWPPFAKAAPMPPLTSTIFACLALRQQRLNDVVFQCAGLPRRVTREVELYLTLYKIYKAREEQQKLQAEMEVLEPLELLRSMLKETIAEKERTKELILQTEDPATAAAALTKLEALAGVIETISRQLAEIIPEEAGQEAAPEGPEEGLSDGGL